MLRSWYLVAKMSEKMNVYAVIRVGEFDSVSGDAESYRRWMLFR